MAKITLNNLTSNYGSQALHNSNNDAIEDALNNKVLYRNNPSGEPNQMENDLDMNSNRILNLNDAATAQEPVTKSQLDAASSLTTQDASASTYTQTGTGATQRTIKSKLDERISVKDFGAVGDGVTDDTSAISAASAAADKVLYYPQGTYLNTNFAHGDVLHLGDDAKWKVGSTEIPIPDVSNATTGDFTVYVNQATGSDTDNNGLSSSFPYRTIQKAYDRLPDHIKHQCTVQLADGTYNDNYLDGSDKVQLPRNAILFGRAKFIANRTQKSGSDLNAGILILGNTTTPGNVIIEPNDTYTYGVYSAQGQIGLQALHIVTAAAATSINNLITSHRGGSYVHCVDVSADGRDKTVTALGLVTEGNANLEFTTTSLPVEVKNCAVLAQPTSRGDNLTISGQWTLSDCNTAINVSNGGRVGLNASGLTGQTISNCSDEAINAQFTSKVTVRGANDSNHITIDGDVKAFSGAALDFVFGDITGATSLISGSTLKMNNSDYQGQILAEDAHIWFNSSDSFISPATANDATKPVLLRDGSTIYAEGTNNWNGSGGEGLYAQDGSDQNIGSSGAVITVPDELRAIVRLAAGGDRTGCTLEAGKYEFQELKLFSVAGNYVEIIESTTATISNNTVRLSGNAVADEYQGVTFVWFQDRWREQSRSRAGA